MYQKFKEILAIISTMYVGGFIFLHKIEEVQFTSESYYRNTVN